MPPEQCFRRHFYFEFQIYNFKYQIYGSEHVSGGINLTFDI